VSHTGLRSIGKVGLVLLLVAAALLPVLLRTRTAAELNTHGLVLGPDGDYVTSEACRECHSAQFDSWHHSYHRTMTQAAGPGVILAPDEDAVLETCSRTYHVWREGDDLWVEMPDPEVDAPGAMAALYETPPENLPRIQRRVVMTTGSHHYQAYWIRSGVGNALRQFPFVYHLEEKRWIPKHESFLCPPNNYPQYAVWNLGCIRCHSVAGQPQLDETGGLNSRAVELGIACESCHGPGRQHVEHQQNLKAGLDTAAEDTIVNPSRLPHELSTQVCGQCHSSFSPLASVNWSVYGFSRSFRPGEEIERSRHTLTFDAPESDERLSLLMETGGLESHYWPDAAARTGGREYLGMLESSCYRQGDMSCLTCHSMHEYTEPADQIKANLDRNDACLNCHAEIGEAAISQHTHHAEGSAGSQCVNCHMPYTTYALFKSIRSHRIDSPVPESVAGGGRPNACNLCHLEQTLQWSAERLTEWYAQPERTFEDDEQSVAAGVLWLHRGDAAQRAISAAAAGLTETSGPTEKEWLIPHLAEALNDPYAAVRMVAYRSLKTLTGDDFPYDYVAPVPQRIAVLEGLQAKWQDRQADRAMDLSEQLLFLPDGALDHDAVLRLQDNREYRQLTIAE